MHLTFALGTAAELIKLYPLARMAVENGYRVRYLATGQSRENFLMQFRDFTLNERDVTWLVSGTTDLQNSASALKWFSRALVQSLRGGSDFEKQTDFVIVHGDTLSTLIGALYGRRRGLPVVHVEAGLRSSQLFNPFPEEITRRMVSRLVTYHMAPDALALGNLREARGQVINTGGNTLLDAVRLAGGATVRPTVPYALVNIHRFENLNSETRWRTIVDTLLRASQKIRLVIVMHPQTRHQLGKDREAAARLRAAGCELRERMPFSSFIGLLKGAEFLISDGGSNQEECSYLGKPCLLLRLSTERQEGLNTCCLLSKFDPDLIDRFLANPRAYNATPMALGESPSRLILEELGRAS